MGLDDEKNRVANSIRGWEFPKLSFLLETGRPEGEVWAMRKEYLQEEQKYKEIHVGKKEKHESWEIGVRTDTSLHVRGHRRGKRWAESLWETARTGLKLEKAN